MKKKAFWGSGILLVVAVLLGIWWSAGKQGSPPEVRVAKVNPTSLSQEVYTTGTVRTTSRQEARAPSLGMIKQVKVKVGDLVQAGQTLVELDTAVADAQVRQAEATWELARANLAAAQENVQALQNSAEALGDGETYAGTGQTSSVTARQQAEAAVNQADASVKQAKAGLDLARVQRAQLIIRADIEGTVLELNAQAGDCASQQVPLAVVGDLKKLEVVTQLNELDAATVQTGQSVKLTSKTLGSTVLAGKVTRVAPEAAVKTSYGGTSVPTVEVGIALDESPPVLKPGFTVNTSIRVAARVGVLTVPLEALFQEGKQNFVYRSEGGKVYRTAIELGIADETSQQVSAGLQAGDLVVLNPAAEFYDGMPVTIATGSEQR